MEVIALVFIALVILAIPVTIGIIIVKVTCDYLARQIAKEIRRSNGELARLIAYELRNTEVGKEE